MDQLLKEHGEKMYTAPLHAPSSRVKPKYLPLVYQWALQIISGLVFVHSHGIIFGDVSTEYCWLSSDHSLSLVAFLNAGWGDGLVPGNWEGIYDSYPAQQKDPTMETDLMLYGWVVYELMTAYHPAIRSRHMRPWKKRPVDEPPRHAWPQLQDEFMGDIVHKCCSGGFKDAEQVKTAIMEFLGARGWDVDDRLRVKGLETSTLFL